MNKLSPTLQRLLLAFTTGLFLACAANVSKAVEIVPVSAVNP